MIELLVAILLFAFGLLGMIGMQSKALGYGHMSLLRSQAAALTDDMMDRLRSDRANALAGNWQITMGETASDVVGSTLAANDQRDWLTQVAALLPSGQASVSVSLTGGVTIAIQWYEQGNDPPGTTTPTTFTSFTTTSRL